eukprot:GFUD01019981.1.p1 GENE.GFUD01019981.1~~GFUD01019981.1.p1  ORF type:complete len:222 (+),score=50.45 GFUD01019981.1:67-732(+)
MMRLANLFLVFVSGLICSTQSAVVNRSSQSGSVTVDGALAVLPDENTNEVPKSNDDVDENLNPIESENTIVVSSSYNDDENLSINEEAVPYIGVISNEDEIDKTVVSDDVAVEDFIEEYDERDERIMNTDGQARNPVKPGSQRRLPIRQQNPFREPPPRRTPSTQHQHRPQQAQDRFDDVLRPSQPSSSNQMNLNFQSSVEVETDKSRGLLGWVLYFLGLE